MIEVRERFPHLKTLAWPRYSAEGAEVAETTCCRSLGNRGARGGISSFRERESESESARARERELITSGYRLLCYLVLLKLTA